MAEEIEDGFAREQAGLLSSLVEHVRLRITLEFGHTVADTADMRDVLGGLDLPTAQTVAEVESRSGTAVPIDELRAENIALRGVLADTMDALEGAVNADEAGTGTSRKSAHFCAAIWPAGCSPSESSPRSPRTWPRAGLTGSAARWSQPGPRPASSDPTSCSPRSSGPPHQADRTAYQERNRADRMRTTRLVRPAAGRTPGTGRRAASRRRPG